MFAALFLPAGTAMARPHAIGGVVPDIAHVSPFQRGSTAGLEPARDASPRARIAAALPYHGGPVLHSNRTHVIFWQPAGSNMQFEAGYTDLVTRFLQNVAADSHLPTNVYGLSGQYHDSNGAAAYNSSYGGSTLDTDPLPPSGCTLPPGPPLGTGPGWSVCLTDNQLQSEIEHVVGVNSLPRGSNDVYFLVTPNGFGSCTPDAANNDRGPDSCSLGGSGTDPLRPYESYCGYHSQTASGLLYAVIPYNAIQGHCQSDNPRPNQNAADPTLSTLSHEHNETVTDPEGDAWIDSSGSEDGDLCATDFGPPVGGSGQLAYNEIVGSGHYFLQEEWSNEDGSTEATACRPYDEIDPVSMSVPHRVLGDRTITMSGSARDPDGQIVSYVWDFGDGRQGSHARTRHVYTRAGTFKLVLGAVDSAQDISLTSQMITAIVPPRPVAKVTAGPSTGAAPSRPRFRFVADAAIATFQCQVDRGRWRSCSSPFTAPRLHRGRHRFSVRARDTFSQTSRRPATYRFRVA
jgi:hypothetical protein